MERMEWMEALLGIIIVLGGTDDRDGLFPVDEL